MNRQAQSKALFRSKLRESSQNRDKRIDSPLVRYNENDQPVCRVCNVTLKSESIWPAHQASRKHHEAIEYVKASAAGVTQANEVNAKKTTELQKPSPSSTLPADFFDSQETKRQKTVPNSDVSESGVGKSAGDYLIQIDRNENNPSNKLDQPSNKLSQAPQKLDSSEVKRVKGVLPDGFFDNVERSESVKLSQFQEPSKMLDGMESKQVKGVLPEGFFDNKDADLRARGIEPVKVDINDAYKEFEKEIQEDLQGVDDRLGEEEIDAAEIREEFESLEQQAYREKVELVKRQLLEVKATRIARGQKSPAFKGKESSDESSSDDDEENDFAVDWRAKRL